MRVCPTGRETSWFYDLRSLNVVRSSHDLSRFAIPSWKGAESLVYLDDSGCDKVFPSSFDTSWSCPLPTVPPESLDPEVQRLMKKQHNVLERAERPHFERCHGSAAVSLKRRCRSPLPLSPPPAKVWVPEGVPLSESAVDNTTLEAAGVPAGVQLCLFLVKRAAAGAAPAGAGGVHAADSAAASANDKLFTRRFCSGGGERLSFETWSSSKVGEARSVARLGKRRHAASLERCFLLATYPRVPSACTRGAAPGTAAARRCQFIAMGNAAGQLREEPCATPASAAPASLGAPLGLDAATTYSTGPCAVGAVNGTCADANACAAAGGTAHTGYCDGPTAMQCCVGAASTSSRTSSRTHASGSRSDGGGTTAADPSLVPLGDLATVVASYDATAGAGGFRRGRSAHRRARFGGAVRRHRPCDTSSPRLLAPSCCAPPPLPPAQG